MIEYAIKIRRVGAKSWWFLSGTGINRLRIHASRFSDEAKAQSMLDANAPNSDYEWKVVRL